MSASNPAKVGDLYTTDEIGFRENVYAVGMGDTQLAQGQEQIWTMPTCTMPWYGQLTVNLTHTGYCNAYGLIAVEAFLDQSTPAPSSQYGGSFTMYSDTSGHWHEAISVAQWRDIFQSTVITPKLRIRMAIGPNNWFQNSYVAWYRVQRL